MSLISKHDRDISRHKSNAFSKPIDDRLQSLQWLDHVRGPLKQIPQSVMDDIKRHFAEGGQDDFSVLTDWKCTFSPDEKDDERAKFVDGDTRKPIQISRFRYGKSTASTWRQIIVAEYKASENFLHDRHAIIFSRGINGNRDDPNEVVEQIWKENTLYHAHNWVVWLPIHRRSRKRSLPVPFNIMYLFVPASLVPSDGVEPPASNQQSRRELGSEEHTPEFDAHHVRKEQGEDQEGTEMEMEKDQGTNPDCYHPSTEIKRPEKRTSVTSGDAANSRQFQTKQPKLENMVRSKFDEEQLRKLPNRAGLSMKMFANSEEGEVITLSDSADEAAPRKKVKFAVVSNSELNHRSIVNSKMSSSITSDTKQPKTQPQSILKYAPNVSKDKSPILSSIIEPDTRPNSLYTPYIQRISVEHGTSVQFENVKVILNDSNDEQKYQLTFRRCNTAIKLLGYALSCGIISAKTVNFAVSIAGEKDILIVPGDEEQYPSFVLEPLRLAIYKRSGNQRAANNQQITMVVKPLIWKQPMILSA